METGPNRGNPQLKLFLAGMALLGVAGGIFETTFNNYLSDVFLISADARGELEFPRELPGFLVALFAGLLFFLPETLIAAFSSLAVGLGMVALAFVEESWLALMIFMVLWSSGVHMMMPVSSSLGMALAEGDRKGSRLGQVQGVATAASVAGCLVVWFALRQVKADYALTYLIGGISALAASAFFFAMRMPGAHLNRPRFVFRRSYWLYYLLAFFFGARKQIFITFGPWVLVKVFAQPASVIAALWIVAALLGVFFQPALGRAIDRYGERLVLMVDSVFVILICLGYAYSYLLANQSYALYLLFFCYVLDLLLFGVNMARSTYLSRIAVVHEDVAPTLGMGVSINHAASMTLPALGGWVWMEWGHSYVFLGAAGVAVLMFIFSAMIRVPQVGRE